jgi:hypothetical protein
VSATGSADSTGTVAATRIAITPATANGCSATGGFGFGGGRNRGGAAGGTAANG